MGEFRDGKRLVSVQRTSGHGVVYTLQTFVARVGLRTQSSHNTVNRLFNVFSIASIQGVPRVKVTTSGECSLC